MPRLIDADALKKQAYPFPCAIGVEYAVSMRAINEAPTVDAVEVSEDFEVILICAVRYALGRQSYMPFLVVGYITPLIPKLSDKALLCFDKDIAERKHLGYGNPIIDEPLIDEPLWMQFLEAVRAERTKRREE